MNDEMLVISPKHVKGEDGFKTFSIRIREDLVKKIDDVASKTGYSRNELIGRFLEYAVERVKIEE